MPLPASSTTFSGLITVRVDHLERLALEVRVDLDLFEGATAGRGSEAVLDVGADSWRPRSPERATLPRSTIFAPV